MKNIKEKEEFKKFQKFYTLEYQHKINVNIKK